MRSRDERDALTRGTAARHAVGSQQALRYSIRCGGGATCPRWSVPRCNLGTISVQMSNRRRDDHASRGRYTRRCGGVCVHEGSGHSNCSMTRGILAWRLTRHGHHASASCSFLAILSYGCRLAHLPNPCLAANWGHSQIQSGPGRRWDRSGRAETRERDAESDA